MYYPKPAPGSYRCPLALGLRAIGRIKESDALMNKQLNLAVVSSITGNVKTQPDLVDVFVTALKKISENHAIPTEVCGYYIEQLTNGSVIPASSDGAYVYDPNDADAVAYVQSQLKKSGNEVLNDLYFKS